MNNEFNIIYNTNIDNNINSDNNYFNNNNDNSINTNHLNNKSSIIIILEIGSIKIGTLDNS